MLSTMKDTMEIYSMFHVALRTEGVGSLLCVMVCTVLMMLMLEAQFQRVVAIIEAVK